MIISKIRLKQFRNIKEQTVRFNSGLNIFYGFNGHGKTNLMEAIYFLTHGKSFRTSDIKVLTNDESRHGFCLESEIIKENIYHGIKVIVSGKTKTIKVNEKKISVSKIRKTFPSILFSPESLQVVRESDNKRRELIDDFCLSMFPDFSTLYGDCQRLLKQKNSLLKKIRERKISTHEGESINGHLSFQFFEKSSHLCLFRLQAIERIKTLLSEEFFKIMGDCDGNVSMEYLVSDRVFESEEKEKIFNAMYKEWKKFRELESLVGRCLVGPHRHGINFKFNGKNARFFCSQGQQRAIILAFKMVQIRLYCKAYGESPVLLLDDVFSELDSKRKVNFLNNLLSVKGQIFITTADQDFAEKKYQFFAFKVNKGCFYKKEIFPERGGPGV